MSTDSAAPALPTQRIGVFIDYRYSYTAARHLFADMSRNTPPPSWFGNVPPVSLARHLVKMPLPNKPRSTRVLGGTHVVINHFDPAAQPGTADRVRVWKDAGAEVTICPPHNQVPGHPRGLVHVALAALVAQRIVSGFYDTAILFAAAPELFSMFALLAGDEVPSSHLERAMWVARDREPEDRLHELAGVWCHRLGERSFRALHDDWSALLARAGRERRTPPPPAIEGAARPKSQRPRSTRPLLRPRRRKHRRRAAQGGYAVGRARNAPARPRRAPFVTCAG